MSILYRVVSEETWQDALRLGYVPRCGNDNKQNGIHLNLPAAVEYTANLYFEEEESPRVLVVDTSAFADNLEWRDPIASEPWLRPLAKIDNLPLSAVTATNRLVLSRLEGCPTFQWDKHTYTDVGAD